MKFKMAPNSLFAILLRSPWWISLLLALALVAVTSALVPPAWRLPAATGALPFLVIAGVAFVRQWGAPGAREVEALEQAAGRLGWAEFAQALGQGFAREGHEVERLAGGAADLRLRRGGRTTLVAAKRWKAARHGEEALAALQAAAQAEDASGRVYVALGELSPQAQRYAKAHGIELLQGAALARLLRGHVRIGV